MGEKEGKEKWGEYGKEEIGERKEETGQNKIERRKIEEKNKLERSKRRGDG
jgi:hypothetical protein